MAFKSKKPMRNCLIISYWLIAFDVINSAILQSHHKLLPEYLLEYFL